MCIDMEYEYSNADPLQIKVMIKFQMFGTTFRGAKKVSIQMFRFTANIVRALNFNPRIVKSLPLIAITIN